MAIERGKRNVLTSSTATISRMGVVSPTIPDVSGLTDMVSKSIANIAETQAKAIDSEYITNFDINTTRFVSDKTNSILNSTEEPDIEKYQKELESYYSAIEKDAPQRLKNQIQQKFYNLYLNGLEHVKGHANKVKYNKAAETFDVWKLTTMDYITNEVNNIIKTQDKSQWFDSLDKLFAKDTTPELFKGNALYENVVALSGGKLNKANTEVINREFMAEAESIRVNSILKMMALSDPDNFEELGKQFLLEYKNDQNNRRAINYEVYGGLSNQVVDKVVSIGRSELTTLVNLNKDATANAIAADKIASAKLYNQVNNDLKNLTNSFVLLNDDNELMSAEEISATYGFSPEKSVKVEMLNASKLKVVEMLREAKTSDKPLYQLLENSSYADAVSDMGGQDEIIRQYYEVDLGLSDDIETYQSDINDVNLQTMLTEVYKNQVAPPGYIAFLNTSTNEPFLKESTIPDIATALFNSYRTWNVATDGGTVEIKNLPANVSRMMKDIHVQQELGNDFTQIAANLKKNADMTGSEKSSLTRKTNSYLEQNPIDVGNMIYEIYQAQSENYKKLILGDREVIGNEDSTVDGYAPMLPNSWFQTWAGIPLGDAPGVGVGFDPLTLINKGLNKLAAAQYGDEFEDVFRKYHDRAFRNSVSFGDTDEALEKKSYAAGFEAMKQMSADGYGYSSFMSPDGEGSFQKYALESVTSMDERNLRNTAAGYILGQIMQYENAGQTDKLIDYGFVDFDGNYLRPTDKEVLEMLEEGKFYFTWNEVEPVSENGEPKASNVRFNLFYNNYEDLKGRPANITSTPQFQFEQTDYFNPNYYTNDIDLNSIKGELINDATNLLPEDATIRRFITEKSTSALTLLWDFATKIKPGDRKNVFDKKMVNEIAQLETDYNFKKGKKLRDMFSNLAYETDGDKLNLFDNYYRNVNIANNGNVAPIPFDVDKAQKIINEVDTTFETLDGFTKTIISEVLYSNKINKTELFNAIKKRNYKKIIKLVGQQQGELIQGMLYSPSDN